MTIEYRLLRADDAEMGPDGDGMSFFGYASRYNSPSEPLPFIETMEPGVWSRSLKSRNNIKAFVNHNTDKVIGSRRAGTLRLEDRDAGLYSHIDLPETTYGRDFSIVVKRGDATGMSVGMSVVRDEWSNDYTRRRVIEARLHEVSGVTGFEAYTETTAAVRSLPLLAKRSGADLDALSDAFVALEAGALNDDQFALLTEAIDRSHVKPDPEPVDLSALQALSDLLAQRVDA